MILISVAVLAITVLLAPTSAPAQVVTVTPGDTVVSEMAAGRIVAIGPDDEVRELATGLKSPRGVAVLADGSILVAELGENRIVGIGGRFGTGAPKAIVSIPFPEGITVSPDGQVFATALQAGEMGRVDIDAGTFTPIARDLEGPGDVAVRGIAMFVTESGPDGRVVTQVAADGRKAEFADGFEQPIGLAFGPGATLFVADFTANRIVRLDAQGVATVFAEIQAPAHLAIEPWIATEGQPFTLSVTSAEGVVRFDETGDRVGVIDLTGTAGIATVPGTGPGGTPGPTVATTAPTPTTAGTAPTTEAGPTESAPATTRPPRTTTSLSDEEGAPSSTSGGILLASVVIIALIVVGGIVFAVVQRPKSGDKSGFEERPLDTNTVALAFGSCAAEEVELAEAEGALASLEIQSESAEKRLTTAEEQVVEARARLVEARRTPRASGSTATTVVVEAPSPEPEPPSTGLRLEDLQLTTAAGKAALNAFLKREIEADELEEMWRALGEDRAIEVVRSARPGGAVTDEPGSDADGDDGAAPADEDGGADPIDAPAVEEPDEESLAVAALAEAEEDVTHAHAEIERLLEREAAARGRISAARAALEACQERHRADLDAEAVANAEAATVAAATARTSGPPAPSAPSSSPAPDADPPTGSDADPDPAPGTDPVPDPVPGPSAPDGGPDDPDRVERAGVLPSLPERPPLTADAATVASLRRPPPTPTPDADDVDEPDADASGPAEATAAGDPEGTAADDDPITPQATSVRRDGLDRGLFDTATDDDPDDDLDDDPDDERSTFPAPPPSFDPDPAPEPDADPDPAAVLDPDPTPDPEPAAADPIAADPPAPDPADDPVDPPAADPVDDDPVDPPADDPADDPDPRDDESVVDPDPMAPQPVRPGSDADDPSLADLLFRGPSDPATPADPPAARLDDLVFAWPSSGFQKLPPAEADEPAADALAEPEPEPADAAGGDDEPPRDDLKFL